MIIDLHWEGDDKNQYLFAGDNPRELAWLEKRKIQWSAVCWLPGIDVGREYNTLAAHQKNLAVKVEHWFERALPSQEAARPSEEPVAEATGVLRNINLNATTTDDLIERLRGPVFGTQTALDAATAIETWKARAERLADMHRDMCVVAGEAVARAEKAEAALASRAAILPVEKSGEKKDR